MIQIRRTAVTVFFIFILPCLAWAWSGKVVGVTDGGTITVLNDGKKEKIRLYGIDCPDKQQDFGEAAKKFTSDLVYGKEVDVEPVAKDRDGSTTAIVLVDGRPLNRKLIEAGLAWVYRQTCDRPECRQWQIFGDNARDKKIGIWSAESPIPPWEFRRNGKTDQEKVQAQAPTVKAPQREMVYHGNLNSKMFHAPGCKYYNCRNCTAVLKTKDEALKAGYRPDGNCVK